MIRPLRDNILLQKDEFVQAVEGGIIIPEIAERTTRFAPTIRGTVQAVGPKVKFVKPGQRIALKHYAGDEIEYDNQRLTLIRERDIVGICP